MNHVFLLRLALDGLALCLLMVGLAYWWLGNLVHELVGTGMFLLLIVHNVFNRRWYGTIPKARREPRAQLNIWLTLVLALMMLTLLITSVMISKALSGIMVPFAGFTVRQVHTLAAYWVLVVVSIHLGFRWPIIMGVARGLCGIRTASTTKTSVLRTITLAGAAHGVWSAVERGVGTKLSMRMTLDWWNFEESVAGFFVHCIAVSGLCISVTYYATKLLGGSKAGKRPAQAPV